MKRIISFILSLIFLLGNIGLSKAAHFCGGLEVKNSLTIGNPHYDCGMNESDVISNQLPSCNISIFKADCCKDVINTFKVKSDFKSEIVLQKKVLLSITLFYHTLRTIKSLEKIEFKFHQFEPPLISLHHSLSLLQVFRI